MKTKRIGKIVVPLVMVLLLVLTAACAPTPKEITPAPTPTPAPEEITLPPTVEWGIIEIHVTDPPPADVKSANVTLTNIEVHKVSGNASGWITIIGAPSSFDLLDVIGVAEVLGSANITAGSFTQIRMDVVEVVGETTDNVSYTAEVPSEKLKIVRPFNVGAGMTTVLTLDFDGEKCLIRTGSNKFLFKPVVKLSIDYKGEIEREEEREREQEREAEDTTPPEITITGVSPGQVVTSPETVSPVFTVSDDTDPSPTVTATLNGNEFTSGTEVSEVGEYELEVTSVDASGNEAELAVNFEIEEE